MTVIYVLGGVVALLVLIALWLKGENLSKYDEDRPVDFECDPDAPHIVAINKVIYETFEVPAKGKKGGEPVLGKRARFDQAGLDGTFSATFTPLSIESDNAPAMSGEWVTHKNSDPNKRILYIHGGAFTVGSAISHRAITSKLSKLTGASVCAINYRLMPENPRLAGIEDCITAYKWILDNGPNGAAPVEKLCVSGDSAGGNLTLRVIQWARDNNVRAADCAVPLSPLADSTCSGQTIKANMASDHMLRPLIGHVVGMWQPLLLWGTWAQTKHAPSSPVISPIFGDLSNLPPTLIHASSTEILFDDACRYVVKAKRAGSDARLQSWSHMPHVWQIFDPVLPEAEHSIKEIAEFMKTHGF
ncbi:MAG: alpha/beta hydrolase [Robiginitomaculum sp.]|nr:MAG: alpha/beta hydrolase [Robiginitomaculum sp.]